jgi:hypothetical protein
LGRQLVPSKRREFYDRKTARQRLGDLGHESRRNGTQQQKTAFALPGLVDLAPQARKNGWPRLCLIQNQQGFPRRKVGPLEVQSQAVGLLFEVEVLA